MNAFCKRSADKVNLGVLIDISQLWNGLSAERNPFPTGNSGILTNKRGDMKYITGV